MKVSSIETLNLKLMAYELLNLMVAHASRHWDLVQMVSDTKVAEYSFWQLEKVQQHVLESKAPAH